MIPVSDDQSPDPAQKVEIYHAGGANFEKNGLLRLKWPARETFVSIAHVFST